MFDYNRCEKCGALGDQIKKALPGDREGQAAFVQEKYSRPKVYTPARPFACATCLGEKVDPQEGANFSGADGMHTPV